MMHLQFMKLTLVCLMFSFGFSFSTQIQAHGGLSLAEDMCKLTIGPYTMHFTGYQPEVSQGKEFCEDIPEIGRTVVVFDYIEEALRPLPTEVRVIRDTGSEEDLDAITIFHMPAKVYPNASINFEYNFTEPGKFIGLVTVGENQEYVSRFPFSVGQPSYTPSLLVFSLMAAFGAGGVFLYKVRRKPSDAPAS